MKRNIKASGYFPKFALRTLLLLIIILSTFTVYAANYDFYVGGIYYKKSGTNVSVVSYTSSSSNYSGDISIPETVIYGGITYNVTTIGSYAFYGCSGLRSVVLPNSITTISYHAFNGCTSLTSINIPNSVTVLDYSAFQNCNALTSLTLGNSIESIGSSAFKGCIALTSIDLPNSLKTIGDYTFSDCGNMTSITIPDSVVSIGFCAFSNCSNLSEAIIGNSVISLGRFIFQGCTNLNSIEFGNSLIEIDYEAFDETAWYINQPDGLVYAGPVLYRYKGTMPDGTSLSLRDGTRGIATWAFYDCNGLTDITLPNSIISISDDAFLSCI